MKSKTVPAKKHHSTTQASRPHLIIFRSNREIYGQITDRAGKILASANSLKMSEKNKIKVAEMVGKQLAGKAKKAGISKIVFDRKKYKYHGRVAALAKGARSGGLEF